MKLSFSTRGWQHLSWENWLDLAEEMRFSGIEVYNLHLYPELCDRGGPFHKSNAAATVRLLHERKLQIPCFDTSCDLSSPDPVHVEHLKKLMETAGQMRVDAVVAVALQDNEAQVMRGLEILIPIARKQQVKLLLKTSGIYADTERLRDILNHYACDEVAVLWDVHHTYHTTQESAAETIRNLGAYAQHVHLRDSDDPDTYNLVGEGTLPITEFVEALASINYNSFISLEWKPEWMSDLDDPAVIFPHFVNYMNRFENPRGKKKELYANFDHTGQYVWKKDELINETFSELLDRMVEEFPNQIAIRYPTLDYTRTYEQFREDVDSYARALVSLGVKAGSKVAIWATNVPAWFLTFWAATKIGAVLVTVNTAYKIHEAEYLLRQSDTHTLVMIESALDANYAEIINELCPELAKTKPGESLHSRKLPFLRNVITVGFQMPGCLSFEKVLARKHLVPQEKILRLAAAVRTDDVCNMQYTSGTTGFPKGVMLTHYNVINNGKAVGDRMDLSTADRMLIQVPMFHCFGMVLAMTAAMSHGSTIYPLPYFSAKSSLASINQERITVFHGVPTMFIAMMNHPDYRKTDFSYMRTGIMAGSGCPAELMRKAAQPDEMNMRGIVSVYGQTETAPGNTMSSWDDPLELRTETVGYAFPHVECKIIDPETGQTVAAGENGEFCARGYNVMKGYYKMPRETHEAIDEDGWLHSGDLACADQDGNYRITGRLKDMIIRGGENIYPKEIEEFIYTHPQVRDVQVIGVPDEKYGEEVMACIILKDEAELSADEMKQFIRARMARHKVPRYVVYVDDFPMNAAGKIQKFKMREEATQWLAEGKVN